MTDVQRLLADIRELPTLPDVVAQLNRLIVDPRTSAGTVNNVLSRDMALSTRILKLVNSSFYGFPRRITSITYAVVILGFNKIRDVALSAFAVDAFRFRSSGLDLRQFWRHALGVASAAQTLSALGGRARQEDDAFMAGLLHDVGKAVLAQFRPKQFDEAIRKARDENRPLRDTELEVLGYDHAAVGGALLERWNLPASLVAATTLHHRPEEAPHGNERLVALTHFSDILARSLLLGHSGDACLPALSPVAWQHLGFAWPDIENAIPDILVHMERSDSFLGG